MFSTLNRHDHAQRKKLFAEKYAMTNIINLDIIQGFQQRAMSVVKQCEASLGSYLDVYVWPALTKRINQLMRYQVTLHCYALDCASHFLLNPGGTDTLNNPEDLKLMQELSYHDSLRRKTITVRRGT